jgi:hypothetical protein
MLSFVSVARVVRTELDVPEITVIDGAMVPFTTEPSPSPGEGPLAGSHGMGLASAVVGRDAAASASEHRRMPNNKKRRGTRILMPAPSASDFRRCSRSTFNGSSPRGAERPVA